MLLLHRCFLAKINIKKIELFFVKIEFWKLPLSLYPSSRIAYIMARRRTTKKTTRTRKKQGVSIIGLAETFALMNVATQTMFNTTPIGFLTGVDKDGNATGGFYGYGYGQHVITIRELIENPFKPQSFGTKGQLALVGGNIKRNGLTGVVQMALIPVAFRLGKNLARPVISRTNRLLNKSGIGSTVKL